MTARPLGIIIVNYGSHALLAENFGDLDLTALHARLVVIDNHTSDAELTAVRELCERQHWMLDHGPNIGFGAGVNRGVDRARSLGCDTFIVINPDARADARALAALAAHARTDRLAIVGPAIYGPDGGHWFTGGSVLVGEGRTTTAPGTNSSAPGGWITGACIAFHSELWSMLGGFDERYFLYWEDVDLSWRCTEAGGRLVVRDDIRITHSVGGTQASSGRAKSPVYYYYNCRNRLLFAARHLDRGDTLRWLLLTPDYARRVLLRGGRRQFLSQPWRPLWASLSGSVRGIRLAARRRQGLAP